MTIVKRSLHFLSLKCKCWRTFFRQKSTSKSALVKVNEILKVWKVEGDSKEDRDKKYIAYGQVFFLLFC